MTTHQIRGISFGVAVVVTILGCRTSHQVTTLPTPSESIASGKVTVPDHEISVSDSEGTEGTASPPVVAEVDGGKKVVADEEPTSEVLLTNYFDPPSPEAEATIPPEPQEATLAVQPIPGMKPEHDVIPGTGLSLEEIEQIALKNNPAISQASASATKASGYRHQVGLYPNPSIGYSGQQLDDAGTAQQMGFVQQDFVTAGKLKLNQKVLDHEVQSQLWEVEAQRYRVLTDVRQRFYEALGAQQRRDLAANFGKVLEEGVRVAEIRREALEGSVPEILQTEIQLNEVELIQLRAQIAYDAAWKQLVAVAGVPEMVPQPLEGELRVSPEAKNWDAIYYELLDRSPALRAAQARVSRSIANLDRQEVQAIPNLQTYLNVGRDTQTRHSIVNLQLGIPLPIFNMNGGNISAAQAEYCRAVQEVRRLELLIQQQLAQAAQQYDSAVVTVNRFEQKILPKSKQNLDLSNKSYVAGEFDYLRVLVARRTFFDTNLQYNRALIQLADAKWLIEGMLLSGGLNSTRDTSLDDGLRGQTLSGQ